MQKRTHCRLLSAAGLLIAMAAAGIPAQAQYNDPYGTPPPRRDNRYDRDSDRRQGEFPFARVQEHLDRVMSAPYLSQHTRGRVEHARKELWDFQKRWADGRYSRHELDEAINAVHRVADSNGLEFRDRQTIQDDVYRMRDFRVRQARFSDGYR